MVLCQDNPAALTSFCEPVFVLRVGGKMIIVDVECSAGLTERCGHALLSKGTIKEEDWLVRQLRRRVRT